ncbi:hypothetical protein DYBT9275_04203 [Dyadobacter sp. CECT 9275]|uniref:Outer membrane protein beta-barrel domain-containing protein n=1 Tax=Dyadobacter helix TaxID=2822344 RepID=A0A916JGA0_9BACT|nr:hypothetical protein [Dyadobacter sp. CECT 9275]CAG5008148.1 hypothetical protein DYBT9275_04203 [Dyadobacter sp. CECT 9275]
MKRLIPLAFALFLLSNQSLFAQASVGYYPWSSSLTVSTNPKKIIWLDARLQTNSLFSGLSIDLLPMVNLKRGEVVQWYLGGGLRLNPLYRISDPKADLITIDGYSVNLGVRISPLPQNRNIQLALELNPYVKDNLESGVLKSNFGLVYFFGKRNKEPLLQP